MNTKTYQFWFFSGAKPLNLPTTPNNSAFLVDTSLKEPPTTPNNSSFLVDTCLKNLPTKPTNPSFLVDKKSLNTLPLHFLETVNHTANAASATSSATKMPSCT